MTEPEVFQLADRALDSVVARIRDDQWDSPMPPNFARRATDKVPTLREIINYHAYDDAWVPDMLAGRTMAEVGGDSFKGDLLGADPKGNFASLVDAACAAAASVTDLDRTVHLSFGDYSTRAYFWQINMFRGLRAHDIAGIIGVDAGLPDALVQGIWDEVCPHAEEWRAIGVVPAAVSVPADAPLLDRLLGLTGRPPRRLKGRERNRAQGSAGIVL
ncbi:MAG: hypothetical protein NVS9B1_24960 [Candidatus Dormibacteraceae bacterium]